MEAEVRAERASAFIDRRAALSQKKNGRFSVACVTSRMFIGWECGCDDVTHVLHPLHVPGCLDSIVKELPRDTSSPAGAVDLTGTGSRQESGCRASVAADFPSPTKKGASFRLNVWLIDFKRLIRQLNPFGFRFTNVCEHRGQVTLQVSSKGSACVAGSVTPAKLWSAASTYA
jgi:hypothetical protein